MYMMNSFNNKDSTLLVSPEQMVGQAVELKKLYMELTEHISRAKTCIISSESFWSSDVSDLMRSVFKDELSATEDTQKRLLETITDLEKIIALYSDTEESLTQEIAGLPDIVIL